jgi:hypothetical protein
MNQGAFGEDAGGSLIALSLWENGTAIDFRGRYDLPEQNLGTVQDEYLLIRSVYGHLF